MTAPELMELSAGAGLTRWSIRVAIAFYLGRVFLDLGLWPGRVAWRRYHVARWFWTIACTLYLVHVLCAFAFFHAFSHTHAYRHTAEQTERVIGLNWGGGLYINYAFTVFWIADAAAWWIGGIRFPYRRRSYLWTLHAIFAFMILNATVVFGPSMWRAVGLTVAVAIVTAVLLARN